MSTAIVPACGTSRRMGRPKLILPLGDQTVIATVVAALRAGGVVRVLVVVPPAGTVEGAGILAAEAATAGAELVVAPEPPADMRGSIELGLRHLARTDSTSDPILIAPADSPGLTARLVARLLAESAAGPGWIRVPWVDGRRGHPLLLPRDLAFQIPTLPAGVGVNALLTRFADRVVPCAVDEPGALEDLDTPDDYCRLGGRPLD